ncbi:MAG: apolipoprotein N-acyltransferase, partial [Cyanobacteria bacterium KgW148]|nr:apolipoprotein N-acyltransferase [Cyanobacteria bacterium KgW148]
MGLCPAPLGWWSLGWLGLVPLWLVVRGAQLRSALALGLVWGCCYHGLALFWLTGVHPLDWLGVPWGASLAIAAGIWTIVVAWGAILAGLWGMGMAGTQGLSPGLRLTIGMALFCALERIWSWSPLYWTALGYTQSPGNLVILQLGKLSGQQAVTAAIVGFNGVVAELLVSFSGRLAIGGVLFFLTTIGYGWWQLSLPLESESISGVKIGLIQGNVSNREKFSPQGNRLSLQRYRDGYAQLARSGVEVVVTPEGALPYGGEALYRSVADLLQTYRVPLWLGGQGELPNTNSLILWSASPTPLARYDKV